MKWLVVINDEGMQAQVPVGEDIEKDAKEEKNLKNRIQLIIVLEHGIDPQSEMSRNEKEEYNELFNKYRNTFYRNKKSATPAEMLGYNMRKRYVGGKYIEVLADLDAKDYSEFSRKYRGYQGAIDILWNTEKIMTGASSDPIKTVKKWIKKLEVEAEDEE